MDLYFCVVSDFHSLLVSFFFLIGLVRFKSLKGVSAAMSKYRMGEIVVQDVAVMIKVLKTDDSDRRTGGWPESGFPPPTQNLSRHSSRAASPVLK